MRDRSTVLSLVGLVATMGWAGLLLSKVQNELASLRNFASYEVAWWALTALLS